MTDQVKYKVCYSDNEADYIEDFSSLDEAFDWIETLIDDVGIYYIEVEREDNAN